MARKKTSQKGAFGDMLRKDAAAVRLRHQRFGVRRSLTRPQINEAAETFNADGRMMGATKKLIDTKHPLYRKVDNIRFRATQYWRANTVPFPEDGIRLIRRDRIADFDDEMNELRLELSSAVGELQSHYSTLRAEAAQRLGELFNEADYPERIDTEFSLGWEYPSVEPPDYLKELSPRLYEQEAARVRAQFDQAVHLMESAFVKEFNELVTRLVERLTGDHDGKPKKFKNSSVDKLSEFFGRFKELSVGSAPELDKLVKTAQDAVKGITPDELRNDQGVREQVHTDLSKIAEVLDALMVEKPKRAISFDDED